MNTDSRIRALQKLGDRTRRVNEDRIVILRIGTEVREKSRSMVLLESSIRSVIKKDKCHGE